MNRENLDKRCRFNRRNCLTPYTMIYTDQMQREIQVKASPQRIISLVPSQTELLADLGLGERVVGITKFCVRPEQWFREKTRIGGTKHYHLNKIRALQPDLIIGNKEENDREQVEILMEEFPVWMSDVKDLPDALQMIESLAELTETRKQASPIIQDIQDRFAQLESRFSTKTPIPAAYLIWHQPLMVAGGDTFIHAMMKRAGFENVMGDTNRYPEVTLARLQAAKPRCLLLSSEPFPFKAKHLTFYQQHFPEAQVQLVDGELFSWYGSRLSYSASYFQKLGGGGCAWGG